jgi:hypothetical protein
MGMGHLPMSSAGGLLPLEKSESRLFLAQNRRPFRKPQKLQDAIFPANRTALRRKLRQKRILHSGRFDLKPSERRNRRLFRRVCGEFSWQLELRVCHFATHLRKTRNFLEKHCLPVWVS